MIDLETVVCYMHKETKFRIDLKYIKANFEKKIRFYNSLVDVEVNEKEYEVKDILHSEDWELVLCYFQPVEYMRIMRGDIDKELNDKMVNLIDGRR